MDVMYLKFIPLFFSILFILGCSDEPEPFTLEAETRTVNDGFGSYIDVTDLLITSKIDELTVEDVIANRGNCSLSFGTKNYLPNKLKFGSRFRIRFQGNRCVVSEVDVITSEGEWTFSF